jgi:predicted dehydrogenase
MQKVNIGIIGLGGIAQIIHLPVLSKQDDVNIVAVCDIEKSKARSIAEKYDIPHYYSNHIDLLKRDDLSAVVICTPTDTHTDLTNAAIEYGKDVLVEKPIARSYDEAETILEKSKNLNRKIMVGMNNRFRPDAMVLKTFIQSGELGNIFYVKSGWLKRQSSQERWFTQKKKSGGGVFLDQGIVMLDLSLWLLGFPEVISVSSSMYSSEIKKVEDFTFVLLKLANHSTLTIEVSWTLLLENDFLYCNLFGTKGNALMNPLKVHKELHGNLMNVTPARMEKMENIFKKSFENEIKHFIKSLKGLTPVVSTAEEAVKRMKVVDAIYTSADKGKEIYISEKK